MKLQEIKNPLKENIEPENDLKQMLVNYVGNKVKSNDENVDNFLSKCTSTQC